jgi:hypothetical protein
VGESNILALATPNVISLVARIAAALAVTWSLVIGYRWLGRRSTLLARLFAVGIILRAAGGVALFFISFFGWPFFRSLQLGGGFWTLARDSQMYYAIASDAANHGLSLISDGLPSPLFLRTLAVWMRIFGLSPASALLLNVATYAASTALIVITAGLDDDSESRHLRGVAITLAAFTFSPALLVHSTQPLKDPLCLMFLIAALCGARVLWTGPRGLNRRRVANVAIGTLLMAVGVYGLGGIRPYVCVFLMGAVVAVAAYDIVTGGAAGRRFRDVLEYVALIAVLWIAFVLGAGPYAQPYGAGILATFGSPSTAVDALDSARAGFAASGGATSIAEPAGPAIGGPRGSRSAGDAVRSLVRGVAVFVVPVTALAAASIVSFSGGQGLLVITDLDTLAIDLAVALSVGLLLVSLKGHRLTRPTVFALVLGFLLSASMAYVVTNFGTLFRLRLMGVTPFLMLPVICPRRRQEWSGGVRPSGATPTQTSISAPPNET